MVSQIPSYTEYIGAVDNFLSNSDFYADLNESDQNKILAALLFLLEEFYNDVKNYTPKEVKTVKFTNRVTKLKKDMVKTLTTYFDDYINELNNYEAMKWALEPNIVQFEISLKEYLNSNIDALMNQLRDDVKLKGDYVLLFGLNEDFALYSNFRRAIKRAKEIIKNTSDVLKSKVERQYLEYVYGSEALFNWVCSGVNTCAWCYGIEALGPQPLSSFPSDHPNGACKLVPATGTEYTARYLKNRRYEI